MTREFIQKMKTLDWNKVFNIIMTVIAVMIITISCVYNNNLINLLNAFPELNKFWLFIACGCIFVIWFIDSFIIRSIARSVFSEKYSIFKAIKTTMVGQYFTSISPFGVAGQPMQLFVLTRQGMSSGTAISLLVRKFLVYQTTLTAYSFVVLFFGFFFFNDVLKQLFPFAVIGFATQAFIIALLALFSLNQKVTDKVINGIFHLISKIKIIKNPQEMGEKLKNQLNFYMENNKNMNKDKKFSRKLYILSFVQITVLFSVTFFIYKAYNYEGFPFINMLSCQAFVNMLSSYTPLPGGSGSSEGGFVLVFNLFFDYTVVTQAMLLWRFITYYSCIIFGALFARVASKQKKTAEQPNKQN